MEKQVPLHKLGHDILIDALFPFLDEKDIKSVSLANKELYEYTQDPSVWHDLYYKTFGLQPNPFTMYKWPEMYRWRSKAGLYTWGLRTFGRLGYIGNDVEDEYNTQSQGRGFRVDAGVCKPRKVDQLRDMVVSDVVAGGYSFTVLTADGQLYGIGDVQEHAGQRRSNEQQTVHRGPLQPGPFRLPRIRIGGVIHPQTAERIPQPQIINNAEGQHEQQQEEEELELPLGTVSKAQPKRLRTLDKQEVKFVAVSSGRQHVLALDNFNRVWTWDWSFVYPGTLTQLGQGTVHKLVAGWNFSCAVVEGEGIVVWWNVGGVQHDNKQDNSAKQVETITVGGTSNKLIMDVMCGSSFLVYLTENGELVRVNTSEKSMVADQTLHTRLHGFEAKLDPNSQFVKLSGAYTRFACFSDKDQVFMGTSDQYLEPQIINELQNVGCVSVAMGDHHNMALLRGGKLLTWGCESKCCGCFGLGFDTDVEKLPSATHTTAGLLLEKPTQVPIDGHVLAIAAAGWQSSAIITSEQV